MENSKANEKEIIIKCKLEEMIKAFFKDYVIIWHDPNVNCLGNQEYIAHLKKFCEVFTFTNWEKARDYVHQAKVSCHVITSGTKGELLVKEIYLTQNVEKIYVFCGDKEFHPSWAKTYDKVSCVEDQIETILSQIHQNLVKWSQKGSSLKSDLPAIATLFNDCDKSEMNYRHLRLKILPKFKDRGQAKEDVLALSKGIYTHQSDRKHIEDFEKNYDEYNKEQILRWYTKESFLHKVTNNCLRVSTSDSIQYSRLLIQDIERAIREQYQAKSKNFSGLLYRGASLSEKEWANLKENKGGEIEMGGFLSVSKARNIAENYFYFSSGQMIFITIIVPKGPNEEEQGFAEVDEYSQFAHEKEILFNVRSRFTILETEEKYSQNLPYRHLVLLYGAQGFRKFIAEENGVQEVVSLSNMKSISCTHCKIQAGEMPEKLFFTSLGEPQGQYYCCQKCIGKKGSSDTSALLCVSVLGRTEKIENKKIKGCLLMNSDLAEVPFYGYKCENCPAKKQKQYFTCADCGKRERRWCQNCFEKTLSCRQAGHSIIAEKTPFSFWCEKMSRNELNHSKFQDSLVQDDDQVFQQAKMYIECQEYTKAIEYYNTYIQENEAQGQDNNLATAYNGLGSVLENRGEYLKALRYFLKSLEIRKLVYGDGHPDVAASYANIGLVYSNQGEYKKALEYYLKSLEILRSINGNNPFYMAASYHNLGSVFEKQGEYIKSLEYNMKSLDIRKSIYGDIHPEVAASFTNFGSLYSNQEEYKMALEYYMKSLDIRKSVYGDNHTDVAASYHSLGTVYGKQGECKKALKYNLKSLDIRKSVYGDSHTDVAASYNNLGNVYCSQGECKVALEYYFKGLGIVNSIYGDNHPEVAVFSNKIARVYKNQKEYKMALEYYFKCLDIQKSTSGDNHHELYLSYFNIGKVYSRQGEGKKALEYYFKCLEIQKSIYKENHAHIALSYHRIGLVYSDQNELKIALEYYLESLSIRKSLYGENHCDVSLSYNKIGNAYYGQEEYKTALGYYLKGLKIQKSLCGEYHADVAHSYNNIGNSYYNQREYKAALEYHLKSLDIRVSLYGENHADVATSYKNIGDSCYNQREYKRALEYYLKEFKVQKSLDGENQTDVARSYNSIGNSYYNQREYKAALESYLKSLDIRKSLYGEIHADIATSYNNIGRTYLQQEQSKMALEYFLKCLNIRKSLYGDNHPKTVETSNKIYEIKSQPQNQYSLLSNSQLDEGTSTFEFFSFSRLQKFFSSE